MLKMSELVREKKGGTRASQSGKQTVQTYRIKEAWRAKQTSAIFRVVGGDEAGEVQRVGWSWPGEGLELRHFTPRLTLRAASEGLLTAHSSRLTLRAEIPGEGWSLGRVRPGSRAGEPHSSLRLQSRKSTGKHSASQHSLELSRRKVAVDYVKGSDLLPGKRR